MRIIENTFFHICYVKIQNIVLILKFSLNQINLDTIE